MIKLLFRGHWKIFDKRQPRRGTLDLKNFMSLFVMPATDIVEEDNDL
jgi:hypothetical protein